MLDIKLIREDVDSVIAKLERRGKDFSILRDIKKMDEEKRALTLKVDELKNFRNQKSKELGKIKSQGGDISSVMAEVSHIGDEIDELDVQIKDLDNKIFTTLAAVPNIPRDSIKTGKDETENRELRKWNTPRTFGFEAKPHWDLATDLDILDFDRATKITGSRFTVYKGAGARLERALINFMLDLHTQEQGYTEVFTPVMVNAKTMFGTGQLPKFEEDLFKVKDTDYYLIPTAEVPVTNLFAGEIIDGTKLPIYYTAYTPCFRSEAGAAGRDTRGIIRQHQFNKVEMVKFSKPETSYEELEKLTNNAEEVLQKLGLPYRVIELCTGDIGFSSACTYDIEVWLPSYNAYKEISSCSNMTDFQARRANIRYKENNNSKSEYVHTLNGSGLAIGRTVAAILENYQNEDGSITIPEVLVPYMNGLTKIERK